MEIWLLSVILQNEWVQILKYHLAENFNILNKNLKTPLMNLQFSHIGATSTSFHQTHPFHSLLKE